MQYTLSNLYSFYNIFPIFFPRNKNRNIKELKKKQMQADESTPVIPALGMQPTGQHGLQSEFQVS